MSEEKWPKSLKSQFVHTHSFLKHKGAGSGYAHSDVPTVQRWAWQCACSHMACTGHGPKDSAPQAQLLMAEWRSLASLLCRVTWTTIMGNGQAVGCALGLLHGWAGTPGLSRAHPWSGDAVREVTPGLLAGRALTGLPHRARASEMLLTCHHRPWPSQAMPVRAHSLAILHLHTYIWTNGVFWYAMAFLRNAIHLATVGVGVLLPSCLIPENCCMQTANSLLSSWTHGSQNATTAHLWISINIHHLQRNIAQQQN